MSKLTKYILWELADSNKTFIMTYDQSLAFHEHFCKVDHSNSKNLIWDDDHCGLSYYSCPECHQMFIFW